MRIFGTILAALSLAGAAHAAAPGLPAIQRPFEAVKPVASLKVSGTADWVAIARDAVWVGGSGPDLVVRIDPRTNSITDRVALPGEPCAGMVLGFGALWAPLCGDHPGLARIDLSTRKLDRVTPLPAVMAEAGIAAAGDSLWLPVDDRGGFARLDPATGRVRSVLALPPGSFNPLGQGDRLWVTSTKADRLTAVDARNAVVIGHARTGPQPRFLAAGAGAVWTLNQGDGSVTRIEAASMKVMATTPLGIPGHGGDIAFARGWVFATLMGVPLTAVSAADARPVRQWVGPGGDSLRIGHGAVWLTDYRKGFVARYPLARLVP